MEIYFVSRTIYSDKTIADIHRFRENDRGYKFSYICIEMPMPIVKCMMDKRIFPKTAKHIIRNTLKKRGWHEDFYSVDKWSIGKHIVMYRNNNAYVEMKCGLDSLSNIIN